MTGVASPGSSTSSEISSISCAAAGNCTAVGSYVINKSQGLAFIVSETDGTWGPAQVIPGLASLDGSNAPSASGGQVACAAVGDCTVTGGTSDGDLGGAFVVSETNGSWGNAEALPGLAALGATGGASLMTLSCSSAGNCAAGGNYITATNADVGFVANETGGTWGTAQTVVRQGSAVPGVESLSCTAPGYCSGGGDGSAFGWVMGEGTATATALSGSTANVTFGNEQAETLSATVTSPAGGTPTGTVTVFAGGVTACTMTLTAGSGNCALSATSIPAGSDDLVATYNGDTSYTVSSSAPSTVTVAKAVSATSLGVAKASVTYGQETTEHLTVTVTPQFGGTPTGKVTLKAGRTVICTVTLGKTGKGTCTLTARQLKAGSYTLTAAYGGSTDFRASASPGRALKVLK